MYCSFKDSLLQEYSLSCFTISKFRSELIKFRLGIKDLNINNNYRNNTQLSPFCENVENETHLKNALRKIKRRKKRESKIDKKQESKRIQLTEL